MLHLVDVAFKSQLSHTTLNSEHTSQKDQQETKDLNNTTNRFYQRDIIPLPNRIPILGSGMVVYAYSASS
jgi:hypothetical protein